MKAKSSFSLKDQLFNADKVSYLAGLISETYPEFESSAFHQDVIRAFPHLELKERIAHIADCLRHHLPQSYPEALAIVLDALPPELDPTQTDDDFGDFIFAPLSLFVAKNGCTAEHLGRSLPALKEITKRFSAEYAIRFFINAFPEETFEVLLTWATDENYHVRRLASEGTRPKLPWAQKLVTDYRKPLPLLEQLYGDSTRFVTRSVANHLNDISKVDPALVIQTLERWKGSGKQTDQEIAFVTKHGLRSLIKQGHPEALTLIGFGAEPNIDIIQFSTSTPEVKVGEAFEFMLEIRAKSPQNLLVDYLMQFATNGKKQPQKVFKLKQLALEADESVTLRKKHPMRLMTTRRLTLGEHQIILQVNGQAMGSLSFDLVNVGG